MVILVRGLLKQVWGNDCKMSFGELTGEDWGFSHNVVDYGDKNKMWFFCHEVDWLMKNYRVRCPPTRVTCQEGASSDELSQENCAVKRWFNHW